jgi:hypothetical protein
MDFIGCPRSTMTTFPKELVEKANEVLLPWKPSPKREQLYQWFAEALLLWTKEKCSTTALGLYVLKELNLVPSQKILLLLCDPGINYTREMTILGLRELMGTHRYASLRIAARLHFFVPASFDAFLLGSRFIEYPKHHVMYRSASVKLKADSYGHGFSYSGKKSKFFFDAIKRVIFY